ncbi:MAG: endonuclease domain-containing protein [Phycisphaerales bacterium JB065]
MPDRDPIDRARRLRRELSPPERVLWARLRNGQLAGLKFRRQHPVGPYVADFFCAAARLVIEIDGRVHERRSAHDRARYRWMQEDGIRVLRIPAHEISRDLDAVLRTIHRAAVRGIEEESE